MRCQFCGDNGTVYLPPTVDHLVRACDRCAPLCARILTREANREHPREVMIAQHQNAPRRKLLELKNHSITVFFSDSPPLAVTALEIESRRDRRVVKWQHGSPVREFVVNNVGRTYADWDEMIACPGFNFTALNEDIQRSQNQLQPRITDAFSELTMP